MEVINIIIRTIFFYFFITIAYRLMGKREIGQLGIIDLIVSILIAELVAISIENLNEPIYFTIVPICILVLLEIFLAYLSIKNKTMRIILEGKPSLIISNGRINYHEMITQRYTLDDLLVALRSKSIKDIREVEYAFLEANGTLSVFTYQSPKKKGIYPMPVIIDGKVDKQTLKYLKKDLNWLKRILNNHNLLIEDVFYAFYKKNKLYFIKKADY